MAAEDLRLRHGAISSALTVTNLNSLADGDIWISAALSDASPHHLHVLLSYTVEFNATPIAGDYLEIYRLHGNNDGTILWPAGLTDGEQKIVAASAAAKAEFLAAVKPVIRHEWQTSHSAIFKNFLTLTLMSPNFRFAVRPVGEALKATGHTLKYTLATPQRQTS